LGPYIDEATCNASCSEGEPWWCCTIGFACIQSATNPAACAGPYADEAICNNDCAGDGPGGPIDEDPPVEDPPP
jgi:hypothetical protein